MIRAGPSGIGFFPVDIYPLWVYYRGNREAAWAAEKEGI